MTQLNHTHQFKCVTCKEKVVLNVCYKCSRIIPLNTSCSHCSEEKCTCSPECRKLKCGCATNCPVHSLPSEEKVDCGCHWVINDTYWMCPKHRCLPSNNKDSGCKCYCHSERLGRVFLGDKTYHNHPEDCTPPITETTDKEWTKEFNKRFDYTFFTWNGDSFTGATEARRARTKMKKFISKTIQQAQNKERKRLLEEIEKKVIDMYHDKEYTEGRDRGVFNGHRYACQGVIDFLVELKAQDKGDKDE